MNGIRGIVGARVLLADGEVAKADIAFSDGHIAGLGQAGSERCIDAGGLLVLPGIVDIHGDAFERQIAPRPEVQFPLGMAMAESDRQLVANGITTAFHGITCSWEGGLRGIDTARTIIRHLAESWSAFSADNRVHLRFENHNVDAAGEVLQWMEDGLVDFLAFNDHLPAIARRLKDDGRVAKYAERAGVSVARFRDIVEASQARREEVPEVVRRLAEQALRVGLPMASHDDTSEADRVHYQAMGCEISEFPMCREAAMLAREMGSPVVMGAPNVVRGGSHISGVRAADMVREGACSVLASDYFYPTMLAAPFRLQQDGVAPLAEAWNLVSRNAARAAGLDDRGEIRAGQRADLILVDDSRPGSPRLVATLVAGEPRHVSRQLAVH